MLVYTTLVEITDILAFLFFALAQNDNVKGVCIFVNNSE